MIWKAISNWEECYKIGSHGRVYSISRVIIGKNERKKTIRGKLIDIRLSDFGYVICGLSRNGRTVTRLVHLLVAKAFIPNPKKFPQVNHKDGNKQNNHYTNLEWCTSSYNLLHAYKSKLKKPRPSLSKKELRRLKNERTNGQWSRHPISLFDLKNKKRIDFESINSAARNIGSTQSTISKSLQRNGIILKRYQTL